MALKDHILGSDSWFQELARIVENHEDRITNIASDLASLRSENTGDHSTFATQIANLTTPPEEE